MSPDDALDHHGSHRDLLWSGDDVQPEPINAIIVPTARRPAHLTAAANLADALGCTLVTLHSKQWTSADAAMARLRNPARMVAIDIADPARLRLPRWETSRTLSQWEYSRRHPGMVQSRLRPRTDLSAKRNLGLILSHLLGWSRIMFLDDDITNLDPRDVGRASGLLSTYTAVGLHICGFHDHSVVCHAYRDAGGKQTSFIGGGALVVHAGRSTSFFPEIYNDDWFFLLDGKKGLRPAAVLGRADQYPYDPFRPERARSEEFGDVLAEGVYWLLDQGLSVTEADQAHWTTFLANRRHFIERVRTMVAGDRNLTPAERARRDSALRESLGRLAVITPQLCVDYLQAWLADQLTWQRHLDDLPTDVELARALSMLSADGAPPLKSRQRARAGRSAGWSPGPVRPRAISECSAAQPRTAIVTAAAAAGFARQAAGFARQAAP